MSIKALLSSKVSQAMVAAGIPDDCPAVVVPSKQAKFGDFQANGVMGAAKKIGTNPRELAAKVIENLDLGDIASKTEIAGPGFINIFLKDSYISQLLSQSAGNTQAATEQRQEIVVIDYSAPNLAKEMHVGHLRSTIIGDSIARVLEFRGYQVIRQNHMGDWGTQFGMLIAELESIEEAADMALGDLEKFYQQSKAHFDADKAFAQKARDYVVKLQSGDAHCLTLWQRFIDISVSHSIDIYRTLGVTLTKEDIKPESAYNNMLADVVSELSDQGIVVDDNGAKVAFLQELADKEGKPSPAIVQKSGGGYLYATTDLAAIKHRIGTLHADRILYFIDARQSLHMKQVFTIAKKAGFVDDKVSLEHHAFGTMMGKDGKPFKTRTGGTVKLADLLVEATERAASQLQQRASDLSDEERTIVARKVGIGAVKYADLCKTRTNDYIFDWDSMLSFEGNTAPYLQYAYTRIRSVFRKANIASADLNSIAIVEKEERVLAMLLLQLPEIIDQLAVDAYPHIMCSYLYELASAYMSFYEACPILKDGVSAEQKASRLALSELSANTLACGLDLLGIEVMDYM